MMEGKIKYHTRHQKELEEYFSAFPGTHFTVQDICTAFSEMGQPIGTATVYRTLERMVEEGRMRKYFIEAGSPACFEFIPEQGDCVSEICFHLKCEKCGRLIHMQCEELAGLKGHLLQEHHFQLNPLRTVLYGICEDCSGKEAAYGPDSRG